MFRPFLGYLCRLWLGQIRFNWAVAGNPTFGFLGFPDSICLFTIKLSLEYDDD